MGAIERLWAGLKPEQRSLFAQLIRYGVVGVGVTLFQIAFYNALAGSAAAPRMRPLAANTIATALAMLVGYAIHSRFTFRGHGERQSETKSALRFVVANLFGFALNSLWVWLCVDRLGGPRWTPSLPMFFVTPAFLFWLNRVWVFE